MAEAFEPRIELAAETRIDFKSALQELLARRGARVTYEVVAATGPPHRRTFEVAAIVDAERVGTGKGWSKKAAEQVAAEEAWRILGVNRPAVCVRAEREPLGGCEERAACT